MKLLKLLFDFYLDASVHVALAVFCFIYLTGFFLDIPIDSGLTFFLFFGTIASYNFIKYGLEAEKYILVANRYHKNIQFFSLIALGCSAYYAYFLEPETWVVIGILGLLTGFYALPVLPDAKNFRSLGGFKLFPVALVWAGATVILVVIENGRGLAFDVWVETFQRFLLVFILMLPFEIRDLRYDNPDLKTIPQRYGVNGTRKIGLALIVIFFSLTFFKDNVQNMEPVMKAVFALSLLIAILYMRQDQSKYFATFWVEALPIMWFVLSWGMKGYL